MEGAKFMEEIRITFDEAIQKCEKIEVLLPEDYLSDISILLAILTLAIALIGVFSDIKKDSNYNGFAFSNIKPIGYIVALLMIISGISNYAITTMSDQYKVKAECYEDARKAQNEKIMKQINELVTNVDDKTNKISNATGQVVEHTGALSLQTKTLNEQTSKLAGQTEVLSAATVDISEKVSGIDENVEAMKSATSALQSDSKQLKMMIEQTNELAMKQYNNATLLQSYSLKLLSIDASTECLRYANNNIYWQIFAEGQKLSGQEPKSAIKTAGSPITISDSSPLSLSKIGDHPSFIFNGYVRYDNGTAWNGNIKYPYSATFEQDVFYEDDDRNSLLINAGPNCNITIDFSIKKN